jgi:hypothetical protein
MGPGGPGPVVVEEEPQFLSLSSIVTRLVFKLGEYSLINVPARTLYERQIAAAAVAARMGGGPGRTLDEAAPSSSQDNNKPNPVQTLVNYYTEEGAVRIIGATALGSANDLIHGVLASVSYGIVPLPRPLRLFALRPSRLNQTDLGVCAVCGVWRCSVLPYGAGAAGHDVGRGH